MRGWASMSVDFRVACDGEFFFFSSRRRHTRFDCDWSSDVCSSDLTEGLGIAAPAFQSYVMPAALVLLFLLFSVQKYGTAGVGGVFGPIMLVWFTTIGLLGAIEIVRAPAILLALNPWYGARLFWEHRAAAFLVLGAVVLAVTGAEALYADLGHFGRRPIRLAWI